MSNVLTRAANCFAAIAENNVNKLFENYDFYRPEFYTKKHDEANVSFAEYAIICRSWDCFDFLLKVKFPLNHKDEFGNTVLHYLCQHSFDEQYLKKTLARKPRKDIKNNSGDIALIHAIFWNRPTFIKPLFVRDFRRENGETPLVLAIRTRKWQCAEKLIEAGHNITEKYNDINIIDLANLKKPMVKDDSMIYFVNEDYINFQKRLKSRI